MDTREGLRSGGGMIDSEQKKEKKRKRYGLQGLFCLQPLGEKAPRGPSPHKSLAPCGDITNLVPVPNVCVAKCLSPEPGGTQRFSQRPWLRRRTVTATPRPLMTRFAYHGSIVFSLLQSPGSLTWILYWNQSRKAPSRMARRRCTTLHFRFVQECSVSSFS